MVLPSTGDLSFNNYSPVDSGYTILAVRLFAVQYLNLYIFHIVLDYFIQLPKHCGISYHRTVIDPQQIHSV